MSGTTTAGAQYAVTGDPAEIHTVSRNLAESLTPALVPVFASTTARDSAYGMSPTGNPKCWITNRSGHCTWNGTAWRWDPQRNVLFNQYRASAADIPAGGSIALHLMPPTSLPPGNRYVEVTMKSTVTNLPGQAACIPRIYDNNTNLGVRAYMPAGNNTIDLQWTLPLLVLSGSLYIGFYGHDSLGVSSLSFTASTLQVLDLGPTDS